MNIFKYEGYKVVIDPIALTLKVFKKIWDRDKSKTKDKAMMELSFIYFFCDTRSDFKIIEDDDERIKEIKEQEGLPSKWYPDKVITEAIEFYEKFKSESELSYEDTKFIASKFRKKMKEIDFDSLEIKDMKNVQSILKDMPSLIRELNETEKVLAKTDSSSSKMRGQGEKTIMEDTLLI